MKSLITAIVVAFAIHATESMAANASNKRIPVFDFRGISLGMSLTDFKQARFEISSYQPGEREEKSASFAVCSDSSDKDDIYWPSHTTSMASSGGITCVFAFSPRGDYRFKKIKQAQITIGGHECDSYWFDFIALPGDPEPRLFRMVFLPSSLAHDLIVESLTAKFGKPSEVNYETLQVGFNAEPENPIHIWKSKVATIETQKLFGSSDHGIMIYELTKYVRHVEAKGNRKSKNPDF